MSDLSVRWSKEALNALVQLSNQGDIRSPRGNRLRLAVQDERRGRVHLTTVEEFVPDEVPKEVAPVSTKRSPKRARKGKGNAKPRTKR